MRQSLFQLHSFLGNVIEDIGLDNYLDRVLNVDEQGGPTYFPGKDSVFFGVDAWESLTRHLEEMRKPTSPPPAEDTASLASTSTMVSLSAHP